MKRWWAAGTTLAALVVLVGVTTCKKEDDQRQAPAAERSTTNEVALNVQGMHCATCPVTVRTAAKGVTGVVDARVSMDEGKAWVTFDPARTDPTKIAEAITESGYPSTRIP